LNGGAEVTGLPRNYQQPLASTAGRESDTQFRKNCIEQW